MKVLTKENVEKIGVFAKKTANVVVPIASMVLFSDTARRKLYELRYISNKVNYDDAVKAIMTSSMWSNGKAEAIAVLKKNEEPSYYKAVIEVVRSSMFSDDKLKVIKEMNVAE